jgi:uncharacterized protein YjbJ (UPF0337 family)
MSNETIKGNFEQLKGKIKQKWGELSDDEIESSKGDWNVLTGKLVERYGMLKDKAAEEVSDFLKSLKEKAGDENSAAGDEPGFVKEQLHKTVASAKENLGEVSDAFSKYVRKNPVASVAIALASGIALAMIMRS